MVVLDVLQGVVVEARVDVVAALLSTLADLVHVRLGSFVEVTGAENEAPDLDT